MSVVAVHVVSYPDVLLYIIEHKLRPGTKTDLTVTASTQSCKFDSV